MDSTKQIVSSVPRVEKKITAFPAYQRTKRALKRSLKYSIYPVRSLLQPRRFRAYCVGTPKSGTHSMAGMFQDCYRAAHEPEAQLVIKAMLAAHGGATSQATITRLFEKRDKRLWLELESSHHLCSFLDVLVKSFPHAKFILTIRDCYSWLDSYINHQLSRHQRQPATDLISWFRMRDASFGSEMFRHAGQEKVLADNGLYTLDGYLSFWAAHNRKVLSVVPSEKLLIVRTHEIRRDIQKISDFLEIPAASLDSGQAHAYKAERKFAILSQIDRSFLDAKVALHCGDLMQDYFPEVRSLDDTVRP